MASPMQPFGDKLPTAPRAGFAAGGEAEGGRADARYVHTIGTSSKARTWRGLSVEGEYLLRRKQRQKVVLQLVDSLNKCGREKQAKALASCGSYFDVWIRPGGEVKLLPCPCDSMFCPECANRRAQPLIEKLKTLVNRPGRSYWFLTLTVPNTENLSRLDISAISDQFAELWKSWVFQAFEDEKGITRKIYGGVRSIECVYNQALKSWHPHIHVFFEAPRRLPPWWLTLLKTAWNRITGDALYVHLEPAYTVDKHGRKKVGRLNEKALREVCKYVTKCAEFATDHLLVDEFCNAFKGVRRIQCFGSFHGAAAREFEREPGADTAGISEADVRLSDQGFKRVPFRAHISETLLLADGTRQLKFAFMARVEAYQQAKDPPWELTPDEVELSEQSRIEFAGAMPGKSVWQPTLFEGAA
jgi:plasmid rolling circle replication initiator protein Rep